MTRRVTIQVGLAMFAAIGLSGCASSPALPTAALVSASPDQLKATGKGVIVVSGAAEINALWKTHPQMSMTFAPPLADGKPDIMQSIVTDLNASTTKPFVAEVPAGELVLATFSYSAHNAKYTNMAGMMGLPMARLKIAAGEVLYIGHLKVIEEPSLVAQSKPKFKVAVDNHEAAARAHLGTLHPSLAPLMKFQPLAVLPAMLAGR